MTTAINYFSILEVPISPLASSILLSLICLKLNLGRRGAYNEDRKTVSAYISNVNDH